MDYYYSLGIVLESLKANESQVTSVQSDVEITMKNIGGVRGKT